MKAVFAIFAVFLAIDIAALPIGLKGRVPAPTALATTHTAVKQAVCPTATQIVEWYCLREARDVPVASRKVREKLMKAMEAWGNSNELTGWVDLMYNTRAYQINPRVMAVRPDAHKIIARLLGGVAGYGEPCHLTQDLITAARTANLGAPNIFDAINAQCTRMIETYTARGMLAELFYEAIRHEFRPRGLYHDCTTPVVTDTINPDGLITPPILDSDTVVANNDVSQPLDERSLMGQSVSL
jgi:hypothetical protein